MEFCSQSAKMSLIGDSIAEDFLRNFQEICQKAYLAKDQETSASVLSIKFLLIKCYRLPFVRILLNLANFGVAEEAIVWRCSVEKFFYRNFAKFKGKRPCQSLIFNKVAGLSLQLCLKKDSGTGVSLRILRNF